MYEHPLIHRNFIFMAFLGSALLKPTIISFTVLTSLLISLTASSNENIGSHLSANDLNDITRIESYLESITTIESGFIEMASTGEISEGKIRIWRPGRLRIDYNPPKPLIIKTNGLFLVIYDKELDQATQIPLATTPISFLIAEKIELNGRQLTVAKIRRRSNTIEVEITQKEDPLAGEVTIIFSDNPLTLQQWIVKDAHGITTNFALTGARTGVEFDPAIFVSKVKKLKRMD